MLAVYFFIGIVTLLAVGFVSFSYRKKQSQEFSKEKKEDAAGKMYR